MEYKLVNFGHEQPVEVRIIAVSADSQFIDPHFQFPVSMDNHGVEHAIILPPPPAPLEDVLTFKYLAPPLFGAGYFEVREWELLPDTEVIVNWGDGSAPETFTNATGLPSHDYTLDETEYLITFKANKLIQKAIFVCEDALTEIVNFGAKPIINPQFCFSGLTKVPATLPPYVTNGSLMFWGCYALNDPNISGWDVSNISLMNEMFGECYAFNQSLANWDVSSVTSMYSMFNDATVYNQPMNTWDVKSVTSFNMMFKNAAAFNQPLNSWIMSSATSLDSMFNGAEAFNQPLDNWDVRNVTIMDRLLSRATAFSQDLSGWCVPNIVALPYMFNGGGGLLTPEQLPVWGTCPNG